jgi:hypothetical protein
MNLLLGFFYKVNTIESSFSWFHLIQRSSTLATIQSFKWSHLDALLITVVVREFSERQPFLPGAITRDDASSKHVFKNLIHMLSLS